MWQDAKNAFTNLMRGLMRVACRHTDAGFGADARNHGGHDGRHDGRIMDYLVGAAPYVHRDETPIRINGRRGYVWLVCWNDAAYVACTHTGGRVVLALYFSRLVDKPSVTDRFHSAAMCHRTASVDTFVRPSLSGISRSSGLTSIPISSTTKLTVTVPVSSSMFTFMHSIIIMRLGASCIGHIVKGSTVTVMGSNVEMTVLAPL